MTDGRLVLLVTGPLPGNEGSAGVAAAGLLWELRHVAGVPVSAVLAEPRPEPAPAESAASSLAVPASATSPPGVPPARPLAVPKGGGIGTVVELAVTGFFSATTVAAIAQVAVAFVRRGAARQITLRDGRRSLSITDPSDETERAVREWLTALKRDRTGAGSGAD